MSNNLRSPKGIEFEYNHTQTTDEQIEAHNQAIERYVDERIIKERQATKRYVEDTINDHFVKHLECLHDGQTPTESVAGVYVKLGEPLIWHRSEPELVLVEGEGKNVCFVECLIYSAGRLVKCEINREHLTTRDGKPVKGVRA